MIFSMTVIAFEFAFTKWLYPFSYMGIGAEMPSDRSGVVLCL